MATNFLLKRSGTASKRPVAASMALGELDLNYDASTGGIFYKDSAGGVVKVGPAQVGSTAPNASPAGSAGNSVGEFWYDTGASALKIWDGSVWVATGGGGGGSGTVTSITAGSGLTGGTITTTGTISLDTNSVIQPTIFNAKGELIAAFSANTPMTVSAGADGQVLTACSGCAAGMYWAPSGGGGGSPATPTTEGSMYGCTTTGNSALGYNALASNGGAGNTAIGLNALFTTDGGTSNVAVGDGAAYSNCQGNYNVAVGTGALCSNVDASNNVAVGQSAMGGNISGVQNTALGSVAMSGNVSGCFNTAVGQLSMGGITTGCNNVAIGASASAGTLSSSENVTLGSNSGTNLGVSCYNTLVGATTGFFLTTGCYNTLLGSGIYSNIDSGSSNIIISSKDSGGNNNPVYNFSGGENDRVLIGTGTTTDAYIQVAWTVVSDARDKMVEGPVPHGLGFVEQLEPKTFYFKENRESDNPNGPKRYGFLAQDILALEGNDAVIIDTEDPEKLKYHGEALVPVLVNAIKELSAEVKSLRAELNQLKSN